MNNTDKYDLITNIISLANNNADFTATIKNLSEECHVPIPYMRSTIVTFLNNQIIKYCISDPDDNSEDSFIESFEDNPKYYIKQILSGEYDDYEWILDLKILSHAEQELLFSVSPTEFIEANSAIHQTSLYRIKDNKPPISDLIRKNYRIIEEAIACEKNIHFIYGRTKDDAQEYTVLPHRFITNATDNWIYMQSSTGYSFRLDRFINFCEITDTTNATEDLSENVNQKYVWGVGYDNGESKTHVKLRISACTSNLLNKIERDIRFRKDTCKLYKDGDYYYYEDDIIGMGSFRRWVRGYGSSMIFIEPQNIANEITNRARETLDNYPKSDSWSDL